MSQRPTSAGLHSSSALDDAGHENDSGTSNSISRSFDSNGPDGPQSVEDGNALHRSSPQSPVSSQRVMAGPVFGAPEHRSSHSLGMQNLLNPAESDIANGAQSQQRSAAHMEPTQKTGINTQRHSSNSLPLSSNGHKAPMMSPASNSDYPSVSPSESRSKISPKSPALRAASLGNISLPRATIDARQSPFVATRNSNYTSEPIGLTLPSIQGGHTPPVPTTQPYFYPSGPPPTPPLVAHRKGGANQVPSSLSNSPATSYSSFSQPGHTSPSQQYNLSASQPPSAAYYGMRYTPSGSPQIPLRSDTSFGPVTSTVGQNTYQLMTLDTDQGPIQVPVDVQAASKMADEKRKRNAGASARFRQRRKEKEREASQTIAKLEQQIRDTNEEKEYYRIERDYFRGLACNNPGQAQIAQRPPSPRHRRVPHGNTTISLVNTQWQGSEDREGQGRNTRRRTNSYTPAYALPPPPTNASIQAAGSASAPTPPFSSIESRPGSGKRPSFTNPFPPRTGPYDPTAPPTYDRGWTHGR